MKYSLLTTVSSTALGVGLLFGLPSAANAGAITYTGYTNGTGTGPGSSLQQATTNTSSYLLGFTITIPDFAPGANQVLQSVVLSDSIVSNATGSLTNGGTGTSPTLYTSTYTTKFALANGTGTPLSFPLGTTYHASPSTSFSLLPGLTKSISLSTSFAGLNNYTITGANVAQFEGSPSFAINFMASGLQSESGVNPLNYSLIGTAIGQVSVTYNYTTSTPSVPEPASLAIIGAGLAGTGVIRRRRKV